MESQGWTADIIFGRQAADREKVNHAFQVRSGQSLDAVSVVSRTQLNRHAVRRVEIGVPPSLFPVQDGFAGERAMGLQK